MPQLTENARPTAASPEILVFPGDRGWDSARQAWNLAVDQRPAAVAVPESVEDVVAVVDHARTLGLRVAVQSTGHGAGNPLDGALLVNLAGMRGVEIDLDARTARVAGGTLWADVVDAAVEHGLTALHGSARDVGVVGYTLGGGVGWLGRKHGLASSSILSAEIVTATGEVVRTDAETNADLFWALRGGGGELGVVTELEIALYPVVEAYAGWLIWPMHRSADVLGAWAAWTRSAPDDVTSIGRLLQIPPFPELPDALRGRQLVAVEAAYLGDEASGRELLEPLRALEPEIDTFAVVSARALTELHRDPPDPVPGRGDGWMLDAFDADAAATLVETAAMDGSAPLVSIEVRHLEGAIGRPSPNGGALSQLDAPYVMFSVGTVTGADSVPAIDERIDDLRSALAPWVSPRAYLNFAERGVDPRAFHGDDAYERLTAIRADVDPDGIFSVAAS